MMYIVVVGGGRIGYNLAKFLITDGHEILLLEKDKTKILALTKEFGDAVVEGDGSLVRVLRAAGATRANVVVAATGNDENNLVICQVAKTVFKCPRVIARVNDPRNEDLFNLLGISPTVNATRIINSLIEEEVKADDMMIPLLTLRGGGVEIIEVQISSSSRVVGKKVGEVHLPEGSIFISLLRGDEVIIPKGDTVLKTGDKVLAILKKEKEPAFRDLL